MNPGRIRSFFPNIRGKVFLPEVQNIRYIKYIKIPVTVTSQVPSLKFLFISALCLWSVR